MISQCGLHVGPGQKDCDSQLHGANRAELGPSHAMDFGLMGGQSCRARMLP